MKAVHIAGSLLLLGVTFCAQAQGPKVVPEGKLGGDWKVADGHQLAAPGYPESGEIGANVCVNMGYAVEPNGNVVDLVVLKSWGNDSRGMPLAEKQITPFAQSVSHAISSWKFAPKGTGTPERTVTSTTVAFVNGMSQADARGHCAIEDLASFLQEKRATFKRGESLKANEWDSTYRGMNRQTRQNNAERILRSGAR